jgi:hypothetical protein
MLTPILQDAANIKHRVGVWVNFGVEEGDVHFGA